MSGIKTYSELISLETFEERFEYLNLHGLVAESTFGSSRYLNQVLYKSSEWKQFRNKIILRDNGMDLGVEGRPIFDKFLIHHLNPITAEDIINRSPCIFDPNNVITTCMLTHNAIHYGSFELINNDLVIRSKNDTCPWKT